MSFMARMRQARESAHSRDQHANKPDAWIGAVIGGANAITAPNGPAWVYVTLNKGDQRGAPLQVINRVISPTWNLPVMLGINKMGQPCVTDIAESQIDAFTSGSSGGSGISFKTAPHSHEYGMGNYDLVDDRRLVEGKIWWRGSDGPFVVYMNAYWYFDGSGVHQYYAGGTLDLTLLLTNASGQHQWIKLGFDPVAGAPVAVAGTPVSVIIPLQPADLAAISFTGYVPLFGVQISYGLAITGEDAFTDCSEVRNGSASTLGGVTSVALSTPVDFTVSGSPVVGAGTLAFTRTHPNISHYADQGNSGTSETDLYTDTLPASTLATDGDSLHVHYAGILTGSATATRELKVYFGGTAIYDSTALSIAAAENWDIDCWIIRDSSSSVRCTIDISITGTALATTPKYSTVTGLTLTNTQILKITGQSAGVGAATNDIIAKLGKVLWSAAA